MKIDYQPVNTMVYSNALRCGDIILLKDTEYIVITRFLTEEDVVLILTNLHIEKPIPIKMVAVPSFVELPLAGVSKDFEPEYLTLIGPADDRL